MKRLITTAITDLAQLRIKAGTLDFLQDENEEVFAAIMQGLIGAYDSAKVYILYGCGLIGTTVASGYAFYNGEVCPVIGNTLTGTLQFKLSVTNGTPDPAKFTDGTFHNVHNVRSLIIVNDSTGFSNYANAVFLPDLSSINNETLLTDSSIGVLRLFSKGGNTVKIEGQLDIPATIPGGGFSFTVVMTDNPVNFDTQTIEGVIGFITSGSVSFVPVQCTISTNATDAAGTLHISVITGGNSVSSSYYGFISLSYTFVIL